MSEAQKPNMKYWQPDHALSANLIGRDGAEDIAWHVAEEVPVAFVYNGQNYAVMLASPMDLLDFAYGFSFSEGIIDSADDIRSVEIHERKQGIDLMITLTGERLERFNVRKQRREIVASSSCGLCGISSAEELFQPPKKITETSRELDYQQVIAVVAEFQQSQPLKKLNRSVHGAGWVNAAGKVVLVREDVGRHCALDKLIGALMQSAQNFSEGYCLVSSRASFEMVSKAIRAGMPALVCLSAPTAFAIRTARAANLTLVNWAQTGMAVF